MPGGDEGSSDENGPDFGGWESSGGSVPPKHRGKQSKFSKNSATTKHRSGEFEYDSTPSGVSVDYKYEYHKSQHLDKRSNDMIDVICENLYKRTGMVGDSCDEMAITRKMVERRAGPSSETTKSRKDVHSSDKGNSRERSKASSHSRATGGKKSDDNSPGSNDKLTKTSAGSQKKERSNEKKTTDLKVTDKGGVTSDSGMAEANTTDGGGDSSSMLHPPSKVKIVKVKEKKNQSDSIVIPCRPKFKRVQTSSNGGAPTSTSRHKLPQAKPITKRISKPTHQPLIIPRYQAPKVPKRILTERWEPIKMQGRQRNRLPKVHKILKNPNRLWTSPAVMFNDVHLWYEINKPWQYLRYDQLELFGRANHRGQVVYQCPSPTPVIHYFDENQRQKLATGLSKSTMRTRPVTLQRTFSDTILNISWE